MLYEVNVQTNGGAEAVEVEAEEYRFDRRANQHVFYGEREGANQFRKIVASFSGDRVNYVKEAS